MEGIEPPSMSVCLVYVKNYDEWLIIGEDEDCPPAAWGYYSNVYSLSGIIREINLKSIKNKTTTNNNPKNKIDHAKNNDFLGLYVVCLSYSQELKFDFNLEIESSKMIKTVSSGEGVFEKLKNNF
jgi:hypothetical protein